MWRGFSPSLAAMSAIDRSMSVVESGSSQPSAASPKAPPAAPEAAAAMRWNLSCEVSLGRSPREVTATSSAFMSAASVALWTPLLPRGRQHLHALLHRGASIEESLAARPGFSSSALARLRSARSGFESVVMAKMLTR